MPPRTAGNTWPREERQLTTLFRNLTAEVEYTLRVIAINQIGDGKPSDEVTATPDPLPAPVDPIPEPTKPSELDKDRVLLSNIGRSDRGLQTVDGSTRRLVQGFTTGDFAARIDTVTLPAPQAASAVLSLGIYEDDGGQPGNLLHSLTAPVEFTNSAALRFAAPGGTGIMLARNAQYFLRIDRVSGTSIIRGATGSDEEDPDSDFGWSLADSCSGCLASRAIRVKVNGESFMPPLISVSDSAAIEGSNVEFSIRLSHAMPSAVTVRYSTTNGTASSDSNAPDGRDYTAATNRTIEFAPGETEKTISIPTDDDSVNETDEAFTLTLSNPSDYAELSDSTSATGTIYNNDETTQTDATLSTLTLTDSNNTTINISPSFERHVALYTASVDGDALSLTAAATLNQSAARLDFIGANSTGNAGEAEYELGMGDNLVEVRLTSEDGQWVKTYTVNVVRTPSDDSTLSDLYLLDANATVLISLTPASFSPTVTDYTTSVPGSINSVILSVTKNHSRASVEIVKGADSYDYDVVSTNLDIGENLITVTVTAEDGTTVTVYNVVATRESPPSTDATLSALVLEDGGGTALSLSPAFDPNINNYLVGVGSETVAATIAAAKSDGGAAVEIEADGTITQDQATVALNVGENLIAVTVTAEDGTTVTVYNVVVTRESPPSTDATLSALALEDGGGTALSLSPAFDPNINNYLVGVGSETVAATIAAAKSDGGAAVEIEADGTITQDQATVALNVGENLIAVTVTAEDGTTVTVYNVVVTRESPPSTDATLSALALEDGGGTALSLSPAFDPNIHDYAVEVGNEVASVTLAATTNHAGASVAIIEAGGISTLDTAAVDLAAGDNLIKAMVTAEDGSTVLVYRVTVTRAEPEVDPLVWTATVTVGSKGPYFPTATGYSLWGEDMGSVSTQSFEWNDKSYRIVGLMRLADGLYLHTSLALPVDFALSVGNQVFQASHSADPSTPARGRYWWSAHSLNWSVGDAVDVSITTIPESQAVAIRPLAPPSALASRIPVSHNGVDGFTFRLEFTEEFPLSFRTLRDGSLEVRGGTIQKTRRVTKGINKAWTITVRPDGTEDMTISLPATQDCEATGAICTTDGRKLHNSVEFRVPGPGAS